MEGRGGGRGGGRSKFKLMDDFVRMSDEELIA